jgi:hypothetical protein
MTYIHVRQPTPVLDWLLHAVPVVTTLLWTLAGAALYLSQTWLIQTYGVEMTSFFLAHLVWGGIQAIVLGVMVFVRWRGAAILLMMMSATAFLFFFGVGLLRRVGDQIAFNFVRAPYDRAVADAFAPRDKPVLIAFPWTDRMTPDLSDGRAIVYDETDAIDGLSSWTWRRLSPRLGELMGGKPTRCIRFAEPHYYLCSFG